MAFEVSEMLHSHLPSVWLFLEFIRKDQRDNEVIVTQLMAGYLRVRHHVKKITNSIKIVGKLKKI